MTTEPPIEIYYLEYKYCWGRERAYGEVCNHPHYPDGHSVYPSKPVSFVRGTDGEPDVMTTYSGHKYHIRSYLGNKEVVIGKIVTDVNRDIE